MQAVRERVGDGAGGQDSLIVTGAIRDGQLPVGCFLSRFTRGHQTVGFLDGLADRFHDVFDGGVSECGYLMRGFEVDSAATQFQGVDGVPVSRWLTPVAKTMAVIRGSMTLYSLVSSNRMTTAVMGARAAPAKTAPMPMSAYAPAGPAKPGAAWWRACP